MIQFGVRRACLPKAGSSPALGTSEHVVM
jgi:hypothetical protein